MYDVSIFKNSNEEVRMKTFDPKTPWGDESNRDNYSNQKNPNHEPTNN